MRTLAPIFFGALISFSAHADISINIIKPVAGSVASGGSLIQVSVSSLYELSSVMASVEDHETNLVISGPSNAWTNTLSLVGLTRGSKILFLVAQDVFGNTSQTQRVFSVDNPPILVVVAPLNGSVARPQLYIEATATDDDPAGTVINVYSPYDMPGTASVVLRGTNTVKGMISILPPRYPLLFEAVDSAGNKRYIARQVLLESSSNLAETAAAPGPILDFTRDRFLYGASPDVSVSSRPYPDPYTFGIPEATILRRLDGGIVTLSKGLPASLTNLWFGFLASTGALLGYQFDQFPVHYEFVSWPGADAVNDYGVLQGQADLKVVGDTAAWKSNGLQLVLRDIVRTNELFTIARSSNGVFYGFDLGPNLDLVYSDSGNLFRSSPATPGKPYVNRTTTELTSAGVYPVTDGTNLVFYRAVSNGIAIARLDADGEEILSVWPVYSSSVQYQANNGWVAFSKPGTSGQEQIWTRSPSGSIVQRTFFGTSSTLESLGPKGEFTFINTSLAPTGRYLTLPGAQPFWIGSAQGQVRWTSGKLSVLLGRSVFEVRIGQLSALAMSDGLCKLSFNGPVGFSYILQTSSNLQQWTDVMRLTNSTTTLWTNQPGPPQQFYRSIIGSD